MTGNFISTSRFCTDKRKVSLIIPFVLFSQGVARVLFGSLWQLCCKIWLAWSKSKKPSEARLFASLYLGQDGWAVGEQWRQTLWFIRRADFVFHKHEHVLVIKITSIWHQSTRTSSRCLIASPKTGKQVSIFTALRSSKETATLFRVNFDNLGKMQSFYSDKTPKSLLTPDGLFLSFLSRSKMIC